MRHLRTSIGITVLLLVALASPSFAVPDPPEMNLSTSGLLVEVSWSEVPGATGYNLYYAPYPFQGMETIEFIDVGMLNEQSFYLWEGAAYYVAITAYDDTGESGFSNIDYFIFGPPTPEWVDDDGDGFTEFQGDCDDASTTINPAAEEICGDGVDQDCDTLDLACEEPQVKTPTFDPAPGAYENASVSLTTTTEGATIYYTTDGSTPTAASAPYTSPIPITAEVTIRAVAVGEGGGISPVASGTYSLRVAQPTLAPSQGVYEGPQTVSIASATPGAIIHYTTDGSTPTTSSPVYSGPIEVATTQTVKALAIKDGMTDSYLRFGVYTIDNQAFAPRLSPASGTFFVPQTVTIQPGRNSVATDFYYTTNGTTPSTSSTLYTGPFMVASSATVKAIAAIPGVAPSESVSVSYNIVSVTGIWAIQLTTGSNNCGQSQGEVTDFGTVQVVQDGENVTVTTPYGSETGTIQGNSLSWSMSYPVTDPVEGTLTFSMTLRMTDENHFSGPVNYTFEGDSLTCSGTGTVSGTRQ